MIKTQITVPDDLYEKAKQIAKVKEWTLSEVFRRGLEYMIEIQPDPSNQKRWQVPEIPCGKVSSKSAEELKTILHKLDDNE